MDRTCIGCRQREPKSNLVRLVLRDGHVVADPKGIEHGRGAWLHVSRECLDTATQKRAANRAFRTPAEVDMSGLGEWLDTCSSQPGGDIHAIQKAGRKPMGTR